MPVKIGYQIISKTKFALSINPNNTTEGSQLILAEPSSTDENQRWLWIFYPLTSASILYNPSTTFYAAPTELDRGANCSLAAARPAHLQCAAHLAGGRGRRLRCHPNAGQHRLEHERVRGKLGAGNESRVVDVGQRSSAERAMGFEDDPDLSRAPEPVTRCRPARRAGIPRRGPGA